MAHGEHGHVARPPTAVAADSRAVRARQGGPSTSPFNRELDTCPVYRFRGLNLFTPLILLTN